MAFPRLALLVGVCLAFTVHRGQSVCDPEKPEDDGGCKKIVAGNPDTFVGDGDIVAEGNVIADRMVTAKAGMWAAGDIVGGRDIKAFGDVEAIGDVKAFDSLIAGDPDQAADHGDVVAERNIVAGFNIEAKGAHVMSEGNVIARAEVAGPVVRAFERVIGGRVQAGDPQEYVVNEGDVVAKRDVQSDDDVQAADDVTARDELRAPTLDAHRCECGSRVITSRAVAGAFEIHSADSEQLPTSMAEWSDSDRSAAYEAFRQLRVRADGDARLGLAAAEVQHIFPSAVKTFVPHVRQADDDEQEEGGNGEGATDAAAAEAPAEEMTIDLTQLLYTQMGVTQDIIKANEDQSETIEDLKRAKADLMAANEAMNETIGELMKANDAILERISRLEQGSSGSNAAPGPIEALQKAVEGLMAP
ncbi:unnamed protein product [Vitrella brassicaformis CCMP3155]|uniref:Polymer-forming cytoskeletal protein n=2 Tax=Vitrella brassicaformis TaxID=1169539 RepID=A0A0G4EYE4_VITBC|nr:unnamed protein product [Vitrella brassicaformis CCMP3155]|eukprot:CEM04160.1 unnamed protein product [Vitrella brassicaformis CCMP3155]